MKSIKEFFTGKKEDEIITEQDIKDNPTNAGARQQQIKDVMERKKKMLQDLDK